MDKTSGVMEPHVEASGPAESSAKVKEADVVAKLLNYELVDEGEKPSDGDRLGCLSCS
jgi:hypothetical protein